VQRRCVVDAVAEVADGVSGALQRMHDALFLRRIDLGKTVGALGQMPQRFVAQTRELFAGEQRLRVEADLRGDMRGDMAVVAGNHLHVHAAQGKGAQHLRRIGLGRIGEAEEAGEREAALVGDAVVALRRDLARGQCQHAHAALALLAGERIERLPCRGIERAQIEHVGDGAFGDE
jgi:hypothetical protein